jgi:hypothetical protein
MGKKRGPTERKTVAAPPFISTTSIVAPAIAEPGVLLAFLERHARAIAIVAVLFASARIIATYNVFNHTFDEPVHIACGMEWLDKGVYTWEAQHPPLSRIMAALGPYLSGLHSQNTERVGDVARLHEGTKILYSGHHYDRTLFLSRLGMLPFFWIACFVVFAWGSRYFNRVIAVLAVFAFTFEPTILAHAGLSTTDMALTAFLGATFLTGTMWLEEPTMRRAVLFGICGGLVVTSKFSCLVFFPASVALALFCYFVIQRPAMSTVWGELRRRLPSLGVAAVVAFFVVWAVYRFSVGPVPFAHIKLPFPELYAGIEEVRQHNSFGQEAYLLGQRSRYGWWYFFPVVFAVKTPLAYLILMMLGIGLTLRGKSGFPHSWVPLAYTGGIFAVAMSASINIGLRHILPVYVAFSLIVGMAAYWILDQSGTKRWRIGALALLAAWFAGSSLLAHPDYLPYFNELAGDHPENIVVDSDLDWGQDIKRLAKRLHEVGATQVYLSTLLAADFEEQHGIPHRNDNLDVVHPPAGWVAIGFTYWKGSRLGLFNKYPDLTLWPDRYPPLERVGKSMLLWYFPPGQQRQ